MTFWRAAGLNYLQYSKVAATCVRNALKKELQTEADKRALMNIKFQKFEKGKGVGPKE
uniref:Mitochondrial ATP synthase subunit epsilon n=1 Tax=Pseudodiaptomus poplesia TaxID=213370 RepID=A0A0U2T8B9_9MAXI|nr:mitochondrial ATP synthase subunit epsilon [Pseudodiaptomus poplesia]